MPSGDQREASQNHKQIAPAHEFENYQHSSEDAHRTAEQFKWKRDNVLSVLITIFSLGAVIFAGLAFYETKRQADAAEMSLHDTRVAFRMDERAWVEIDVKSSYAATTPEPYPVRIFRYGIIPKNVGKTVATNVVAKVISPTTTSISDRLANRLMIEAEQDYIFLGKTPPNFTKDSVFSEIPRSLAPISLAPNTSSPLVLLSRLLAPRVNSKEATTGANWLAASIIWMCLAFRIGTSFASS